MENSKHWIFLEYKNLDNTTNKSLVQFNVLFRYGLFYGTLCMPIRLSLNRFYFLFIPVIFYSVTTRKFTVCAYALFESSVEYENTFYSNISFSQALYLLQLYRYLAMRSILLEPVPTILVYFGGIYLYGTILALTLTCHENSRNMREVNF